MHLKRMLNFLFILSLSLFLSLFFLLYIWIETIDSIVRRLLDESLAHCTIGDNWRHWEYELWGSIYLKNSGIEIVSVLSFSQGSNFFKFNAVSHQSWILILRLSNVRHLFKYYKSILSLFFDFFFIIFIIYFYFTAFQNYFYIFFKEKCKKL